ncbi:MAG: hypothetical protein RL517_335 [Pseudomonadota bacterium]
MAYTHHFDQAVVARYRTAPTVRTVLHRMGSIQEKSIGFKPSNISTTQHRILEMDQRCDWGESYTEAPWLILHHARNASDQLERTINNWQNPVCTKSMIGIHPKAIQSVDSIRERIDPTLHGIEKELDSCHAARTAYDAIERKALLSITNLFDSDKNAWLPKSKLRGHQINGICQILTEFQTDLSAWNAELKACIESNNEREG